MPYVLSLSTNRPAADVLSSTVLSSLSSTNPLVLSSSAAVTVGSSAVVPAAMRGNYEGRWTAADGSVFSTEGHSSARAAADYVRFLSSTYEGMEPAAGSWITVLCHEVPMWTVPVVDEDDTCLM
jgi:hypothetical protein